MEDDLTQFISDHYLLDRVTFAGRLATKGTRIAFRITSDGGEFVVKLTPPGREEAIMQRDVDMVHFLAQSDFPAPRLLRARDGSSFVSFQDRFVTVCSYIQGDNPEPDLLFFEKLGDLLARLHLLPAPAGDFLSDYRPETELPRVKESLSHLTDSTDIEVATKLIKAIDEFPSFDLVPTALIHGDLWFGNILQSGSGELSLIDWDDAGVSYPILDVGYVIAHLCTFTPPGLTVENVVWTPGIAWRPDWASAFLASYRRRRQLSDSEIQILPRAIEFSLLVYLVDWKEAKILPGNYQRLLLFESQVFDVRPVQ